MTQTTRVGLARVLGHVTLIMVIPIVGGAVAGLVIDASLGTSPIAVLSGFVAGNIVAFMGIWLYIRVQRRRMQEDGTRKSDDR